MRCSRQIVFARIYARYRIVSVKQNTWCSRHGRGLLGKARIPEVHGQPNVVYWSYMSTPR